MDEKGTIFTKGGFNALISMVKAALNMAKQAAAKAEENFISVSNGKRIVASAITDKGVSTAPDATFQTMRENILAIPTGDNEIVLNSLSIVTPPDKLHYYYNGLYHESFDPTGMTFEAELEAFGVAMTIPVEQSYIEFFPSGPLEEGTTQVTASFRFGSQSVVAQQPIELVYESPRWSDIEQQDRTWAEFETEFGTWGGVETA